MQRGRAVSLAAKKAVIKTRRIYETPQRGEGFHVLADRVWPRGLSKDDAGADLWLRDEEHSQAVALRGFLQGRQRQ